jgi:hypothetical protein
VGLPVEFLQSEFAFFADGEFDDFAEFAGLTRELLHFIWRHRECDGFVTLCDSCAREQIR